MPSLLLAILSFRVSSFRSTGYWQRWPSAIDCTLRTYTSYVRSALATVSSIHPSGTETRTAIGARPSCTTPLWFFVVRSALVVLGGDAPAPQCPLMNAGLRPKPPSRVQGEGHPKATVFGLRVPLQQDCCQTRAARYSKEAKTT